MYVSCFESELRKTSRAGLFWPSPATLGLALSIVKVERNFWLEEVKNFFRFHFSREEFKLKFALLNKTHSIYKSKYKWVTYYIWQLTAI